ncbi:hypothetical protein CMI44_01050 [Candidatus Pacearchaeota archaeon]|nr:hypothetical protein [Candidatus Pacearchaeota archaeon]|tara:strand:- start:268 stop:1446 length:1179 start_codon:yes stop_codon:yes gene_type:complete
MKILTTNSAGNDKFGGIHTRKIEQIKHSPQDTFHIVELNTEKGYISRDNCNIHKINALERTGGKTIFEILGKSKNYYEFNRGVEKIVNEYQNLIREVSPEVVLIPGTSLTSYFLYKACKREGILDKALQEYAGVLEKEISNYTGDTRVILGQIGKEFVSDIAMDNVTYMFPSNTCRDTVEKIHGINFRKSHVVWNGVSEEFTSSGYNRKVPSELILGYIGRVHHVKNLPFFLGLNENMKDNSKLKIVTDISAAATKPTGKLLLKKITDEEVFYYAPRSKERLKKFYEKEISANIVPSFFETYCNGAVESLVCGTPTLLSDRAGAKEVYHKYGLDDLLFSIHDMNSFENALEHARERDFTIKPGLSKEIYENLYWKKVIGRYKEIIESIASKS